MVSSVLGGYCVRCDESPCYQPAYCDQERDADAAGGWCVRCDYSHFVADCWIERRDRLDCLARNLDVAGALCESFLRGHHFGVAIAAHRDARKASAADCLDVDPQGDDTGDNSYTDKEI